jgi:tetratricopeptide (TPR) repeat protein/tRNA A-37 threonylcarbamoyl transferase component Bud32
MPEPTPPAAPLTQSVADPATATGGRAPALPSRPPPAGTGRYLLGEEIAKGGMGVIYRATDTVLGREVAVKVLQQRFALDSGTARRFADEAHITAQLQHPGIPPVHDLGSLPDGRPSLAMKLIKGQTLDELLKARPDVSAERGRFVAVFEAVCQAIAYAHAHQVIHRDLKPANAMVGAFGEVQVMDWGLAKVLSARPTETAEPEATTAGTLVQSLRDSDGLYTEAGSVLGTPAFMAPEQALGAVAKVDRRSDVFGLGAILAVILTGRPPFAAGSAETARVMAAQGDVAECFGRLDACGAEPDLVALCKRCLAPRPEHRPSDANEVAQAVAALRAAADERARRAELDRVRAEGEAREAQTRAAGQQKLQLAAGLVVVVLLAGLGASRWQMQRATDAEARANQNAQQARDEANARELALAAEKQARQQAYAALRSMTADVVERKFGQGAVLTDDDRAFLRGVIAQYDAFAAIKGDDADSRAARAEGRLRVGRMRYRLGELKEAEEDYGEAREMYQQLAADFPARPEFRQELARDHNNRGNLLSHTGRLKETEEDYGEALRLQKQLAAEFPAHPEFRFELARSHNNRGWLLFATGRLQEAEEDYAEALRLHKQLAADFPARPQFRQDLATSHNNRGLLLMATGRPKEAEEDYGQALRLQKQLATDFPARPEFRQELAHSYNNRASLLQTTGRPKEAAEDYTEALHLQKQLAADFPARPEFRQELARSHYNRGILLSHTGRLKEAEEDYGQALRLQEQLAVDFPNQPDRHNDLAGTCVNLALLQQQQGHGVAAKGLLLEGRPHHLAALEVNPKHPTYRQFYRNHLAVLTEVHAGLLEQQDAIRTAETCRGLGWNAPVDAYDAACFLSRCIPIVAQHGKLDAPQRQAAGQFYSDEAMRLVREAVSKGYKDAAHMQRDTDLAPLRPREDFQKLLKELEATGK